MESILKKYQKIKKYLMIIQQKINIKTTIKKKKQKKIIITLMIIKKLKKIKEK